jgi:hypothetical protein
VQVGAADPTGIHAHQHLVGVGQLGCAQHARTLDPHRALTTLRLLQRLTSLSDMRELQTAGSDRL